MKNISSNKTLGRPRAYNPDDALMQALLTFWQHGYAATSMDDLATAMHMNRPSIYAAFGNKHDLYLKAIAHYREAAHVSVKEAFSAPFLRDSLHQFYTRALDLYLPETGPARGCFAISTAAAEAVDDPIIRHELESLLSDVESQLRARFAQAVTQGELPVDSDAAALAQLAAGMLYNLAIRSRSGTSRAELEAAVASAIAFLCRNP